MNPYLFVGSSRVSLHFHLYCNIISISCQLCVLHCRYSGLSRCQRVFCFESSSLLSVRSGSAKPKQPPFYMRHLCQSSYKLQTVFHCVLLVHKVSTAVQSQTRRRGQGMTGLVLNTGRKPSLAGRFQETGNKPRIWLMSFPVWNCASLNASVLDPREKQSFV